MKRTERSGFTIFELLASLTIFSFMIVALLACFDRGTDLWREGRSRLNSFQGAREALDFMSRDIASAIISASGIYFWGSNTTLTVGTDSYDRDGIYFVCPRDDGLVEIGYEIDDNGTGTNISDDVLDRLYTAAANTDFELDPDDFGNSSGAKDFVPNVTDLNIQYYNGETGAWEDTWDSRRPFEGTTTGSTDDDGILPRAVRITLKTADEYTFKETSNSPSDDRRQHFEIVIVLPDPYGGTP